MDFLTKSENLFFPLIVDSIHIYWYDKHWDRNAILFQVMWAIASLFFFITESAPFPPFYFFSGKALVSVLYFSLFITVMAIVSWQLWGQWSRIQRTERGGCEAGLQTGPETDSATVLWRLMAAPLADSIRTLFSHEKSFFLLS